MIREDRKTYLLNANDKLINYLNKVIGFGKDKIMSQRELAILLNCSNSTVSRWLKKESSLSVDVALKICDILDIDKKEFLGDILLFDDSLFKTRFMNLNDDNKIKVIEYIDYLIYQENNTKNNIK